MKFLWQTSERTDFANRVLESFGNLKRMINNTANASEALCIAETSPTYSLFRTYYTYSPSQPQLFSFTNNQMPVTLLPWYFKVQIPEFMQYLLSPRCIV